jgi:hypothetical protein
MHPPSDGAQTSGAPRWKDNSESASVEDRDTHILGTVIYLYTELGIAGELVAVSWDDIPAPMAVHVDDLCKLHRHRVRP